MKLVAKPGKTHFMDSQRNLTFDQMLTISFKYIVSVSALLIWVSFAWEYLHLKQFQNLLLIANFKTV